MFSPRLLRVWTVKVVGTTSSTSSSRPGPKHSDLAGSKPVSIVTPYGLPLMCSQKSGVLGWCRSTLTTCGPACFTWYSTLYVPSPLSLTSGASTSLPSGSHTSTVKTSPPCASLLPSGSTAWIVNGHGSKVLQPPSTPGPNAYDCGANARSGSAVIGTLNGLPWIGSRAHAISTVCTPGTHGS